MKTSFITIFLLIISLMSHDFLVKQVISFYNPKNDGIYFLSELISNAKITRIPINSRNTVHYLYISYRPSGLLLLCSKTFKKLINKIIIPYTENANIIRPQPIVFQRNTLSSINSLLLNSLHTLLRKNYTVPECFSTNHRLYIR